MLEKFKKFVIGLTPGETVNLDLSKTPAKKFIEHVKITRKGGYYKFETIFMIPEEPASKLVEAIYNPQILEDVFASIPSNPSDLQERINTLAAHLEDELDKTFNHSPS